MLVLTRKKSELIQIGDNIVIKVIRTGSGAVKLGIDAPADVRVMRGELNDQLTAAYQEAEESHSSGRRSRSKVTATSTPAAAEELSAPDRRRAELMEEEEPVSVVSRRKSHSYVA